jgi:hypothetical protein
MGWNGEASRHEATAQGAAGEVEGPAQTRHRSDLTGELHSPADEVSGVSVYLYPSPAEVVGHRDRQVLRPLPEEIGEVFGIKPRMEGQDRRGPAKLRDVQEGGLPGDPFGRW